ncbi:hypothetical protein E4U56_002081 [Claviceps arundinis]|uniref:Uncharacterized protein n=1 Tax=Claviceps arundinis TaxID=1623583 RepID=A0A9P7SPJ8_9HYPO|nr:hypothetical protein E4U56_002081 [Claviceps arundinis]
MSHFISSFRLVPIQLLRVNAGKKIRLREYAASKGKSFDVVSENGLIKPKALDPSSYTDLNKKIADFLEGHAALYTEMLERMACEIRPILNALIISLAEAARIRETVQAYLSLGGFDAMTVMFSNFVTSGGRWENFEGHTLYSCIFISAKL